MSVFREPQAVFPDYLPEFKSFLSVQERTSAELGNADSVFLDLHRKARHAPYGAVQVMQQFAQLCARPSTAGVSATGSDYLTLIGVTYPIFLQ